MNVCIYGASSTQIDAGYIAATEALGEALALAGHSLVYGAGGAGLMGAAARGMTRGGGYIVGVVPSFLKVDGILYEHCDEMVYTETMRERKQIMDERSDAFIVTPGGIGTYEEFFEMYTLKQLGRHNKPIIIYNIGGYYDRLLDMLRFTVEEKFMQPMSLSLLTVATTPQEVLAQLAQPVTDAVDIKKTKFV
ncbi:MAG: TIGR00730 family Rossman fold protein [Clostridia bacterium]|nr:TIGR00730 family Rossman fold protein [Clostridia bacterium]